ncbi:hypothetical protein B0T11DRAFT_318016 [Plectosphaerella cucumerina]|uniref:DUF1295 domain protein n=1 Tax=Plectosphaerella cucumerina TaxID=40658 RepID=A0A8K0TF41_9PEZI|nr:hypothetical protein B0T11DRAFT_318016 [Plectosphaerella cucumerina]
MADQQRTWYGTKTPAFGNDTPNVLKAGGSGAEQDRYAAHFSEKLPSVSDKLPSASDIADKLPKTSGAEQDRYGAHFSGKLPSASDIADKLPRTSGAEQDRYEGWFGGHSLSLEKINRRLPRGSGAEQDRLGSHFGARPTNPVNATAVGLLQSAVLPSFGFHAGLSAVAYGVARYTDRVEVKDWLWPTGLTLNAWWSAIGSRVINDGLSLPEAWSSLNYTEKLLLGGVSAWGLRLFYRIATRSTQRGRDDPRYDAAKKDPNFWNKSLLGMFIPEAIAQTLISLPFTFPFRATLESATSSVLTGYNSAFHDAAVFLFSAGFALEVLADTQLAAHKEQRGASVNRQGVWSIVRHPNYLGDALIHASFPLLLLGSGIAHPIVLLGPALNYAFLRYIGGDKENEASQEERYQHTPSKNQQFQEFKQDKNSFWPALEEFKNEWSWACIAAGVGGVLLERGVRTWLY